jgi:hypothetical protein
MTVPVAVAYLGNQANFVGLAWKPIKSWWLGLFLCETLNDKNWHLNKDGDVSMIHHFRLGSIYEIKFFQNFDEFALSIKKIKLCKFNLINTNCVEQ